MEELESIGLSLYSSAPSSDSTQVLSVSDHHSQLTIDSLTESSGQESQRAHS